MTTTSALQEAIESLRKAMISADRSELIKWTADELVYGHASGRAETKQQFVESMIKRPWSRIALSDQKVTLMDNIAIVHQAIERGRSTDSEVVKELAVWRWNNAQWTMIARQTVAVAVDTHT